jgi:hypothetical protein
MTRTITTNKVVGPAEKEIDIVYIGRIMMMRMLLCGMCVPNSVFFSLSFVHDRLIRGFCVDQRSKTRSPIVRETRIGPIIHMWRSVLP